MLGNGGGGNVWTHLHPPHLLPQIKLLLVICIPVFRVVILVTMSCTKKNSNIILASLTPSQVEHLANIPFISEIPNELHARPGLNEGVN